MDDPTSGAQLILTPHPVTLEGQQHMVAAMQDGEKLGPFLARTVPDWDGDAWEVRINGVIVPHEILDRVRPKSGTVVEVRGVVKRQVLAIVAMAALAYFTIGGGAIAGWSLGTSTALGTSMVQSVAFMAGSALIQKVLAPKPPAQAAMQSDPVHSINSARNQPRQYEPLPLLFGTVRITPDVLSMPYTWYEGNDQYLGMVLTPGINVHSIGPLYNGDTLLSSYEGVQTYLNGFAGHADQTIPLYSNADTIAGGELDEDTTWVQRATPLDTVRIQINLEYLLGDASSKGKPTNNQETVEAQYRAVGSGTWLPLVSRRFVNNNFEQKRATLSADVARGQYDVRVRRMGQHTWEGPERNAKAQFSWVTMTAVQADDTDYTGISRIGTAIKATGQLNGALDEVRTVATALPIPVWNGTAYVTQHTSNPGAQLLAYARGMYDANTRQLGGIGLPDSQIDIDALKAFTLHCAAEGYTYDAYIKDARNHAEMCDAIALAGMGQISWASGKFSVVWAASDQPLSGVVNMATIKKGSFQVDYTLANAADGIEYTYVDPETWQPVTLRVEAPGVAIMQNPARITGEGITDESHAARMARYHLAQHLYQYKDIGYSTDLEHLTYRRMSLLSLSHDMTQWGFSGRVRGASEVGGVVSIALDEPVPAPTSGNAYIGLRIPGEGVFRVFQIAPFAGESDTLTLVGAWPEDAAFPGDDDENPAHDTIWTYDFKATPGYRVRVVSIEPESDLQGARIAVVPESPEFWTYVETGAYTPPVNTSLLQSRPVASNLTIAESQVVQGDTVFTELQADFDVDGPMAYATVHVAQQLDGEWGDLVQVAETRTQEARWRIPAAGLYRIVVRPYNADGIVGGVATVDYLTAGADIPPPQFDSFDVVSLPGGVRKYMWGYDIDTLQAPDFAGAEVRYVTGTVPSPDWATMTPVGNADGFHTAGFEAVVPVAGTWTFAARPRNTSGELGPARVITRTLTDNLGEVIDGIEVDLDEVTQAQVDAQMALDDEIERALLAELDLSNRTDVIAAQVADITSADVWNAATAYPIGDFVQYAGKFYRALTANTNKRPDLNPTDWELIGNYSSLGEAVAASISIGNQNTSDIAAESTRLDAVTARMPSGSGQLATSASVTSEATARANGDSALASDINALQITTGDQSASITQLAEVSAAGLTANSVSNPSFERDAAGWWLGTGATVSDAVPARARSGTHYLQYGASGQEEAYSTVLVPVETGDRVRLAAWIRNVQAAVTGNAIIAARTYDASQGYLALTTVASFNLASVGSGVQTEIAGDYVVPAGVSYVAIQLRGTGTRSNTFTWDDAYLQVLSKTDVQMRARHTVALNVNGHVSGTVNENDGTTSSFSVLATVFRVISTVTGMGMEWLDGYLRIWKGSAQLIIGHTFGVSGNMVFWYGPNIGAAACTKANAKIWFDNSGDAYFGGTLSAGILKNAAQTSQVSTSATVETGPFGTNGNSKVVVASLAYDQDGLLASNPGNATLTATVVLERSYNSGSWTQIGTFNASGSRTVGPIEAGQYPVAWTLSGSVTVTDNQAGTGTFNYRARITANSGNWPFTIGTDPGQQRLAVISTEE